MFSRWRSLHIFFRCGVGKGCRDGSSSRDIASSFRVIHTSYFAPSLFRHSRNFHSCNRPCPFLCCAPSLHRRTKSNRNRGVAVTFLSRRGWSRSAFSCFLFLLCSNAFVCSCSCSCCYLCSCFCSCSHVWLSLSLSLAQSFCT